MVMQEKRGWFRIVEAVLAVIIVFASVLIVISRNHVQDQSESGCDIAGQYLNEISKVESLRYAVITENRSAIDDYMKTKIDNPSLNYNFSLCAPESSCLLPGSISEKIEVCADERIISSARYAVNSQPKKIKLFIYRRN